MLQARVLSQICKPAAAEAGGRGSVRDNPPIAPNRGFRYQRHRALRKGVTMADDVPSGPVEMGAEMDYREHEKTYSMFLALTKYGTLTTVGLLIAMAFGFFTSAGFFSAAILFVLICVVGGFLLRS